ncbi:MAG TPA: class I SAM-dependent methyltransferase [Dehalococcoidia bacterium]|nr:class I SAM-dependent methyltransferase [Dehalococcoidia bacterium]
MRTIEQELEACDIESPPRELFLSYLPKEGKIVDAGCGLGKWVNYLKQRGYDIVGIDNSELAVAKLKNFDESLQVELGDILDIHYPDSSLDAYISMGVVEHFEDGPTPALKEAYRVLKPGGLIFVSVPTVNVIRKLVRRPLRNAINTVPRSLMVKLRLCWGGLKRHSIRAAINAILPETVKGLLLGKRSRGKVSIGKYYHFIEYRYSKAELEDFLKQTGFEVIETIPHDFYDSKDHAIGLVVDFPFLGARNGVNFQLTPPGKLISRILDCISPWIACNSVICVGRSLKGE